MPDSERFNYPAIWLESRMDTCFEAGRVAP